MRNLLVYILLFGVVSIVLFYFWGSSGSISKDKKHFVKEYDDPSRASSDTFSIMTYNLGYLSGMTNNLPIKAGKDLFQSNLRQAQALFRSNPIDIIGFQEIDYGSSRSHGVNQLDELSAGYAQAVVSVNWDKRYVPFPYWPPSVHFGNMKSGQAILSKFPVVNSNMVVLEKPEAAPFYYNAFYLDRLIQMAELKLGNKDLMVFNVHLEAFDRETREAQAKVLKQWVDSFAQVQPLIIMGDFNARPPFATEIVTDEMTMDLFYEHPLLSPAITKEQYLNSERDNFTFDTSQPYEKLDYIFYNHKFIRAVDSGVQQEAGEISDHLPVYFSFSLID